MSSSSTINADKFSDRTIELACGVLAVALTLTFLSSSVGAVTIDFESDPPGPLPPTGFQPTGSNGFIIEYQSAELGDFGIAGEANAFKSTAFGSAGSISGSGFYVITLPNPDFVGLFTSISFDFGNDDPTLTNPGDLAIMRILLAGVVLDVVSLPLNRDSALNQTISFEGAEFARVEFAFTDAFSDPILGLHEVIDNLNIAFAAPEPATLALFGLGLAGIGFARRKKE